CRALTPALHSFPTRRSSDLVLFESSIVFSSHFSCAPLNLNVLLSTHPVQLPIHQCWLQEHPFQLLFQEPILLDLPLFEEPSVFLDRKSTRLNSSHVKISYAV